MGFSPDVPDEPETTGLAEAEAEAAAEARRKAAADRRRKGRRATILSGATDEEASTAFLGRPAGRARALSDLS